LSIAVVHDALVGSSRAKRNTFSVIPGADPGSTVWQ